MSKERDERISFEADMWAILHPIAEHWAADVDRAADAPPILPRLCADHAPVIHSAARLQHVGERDVLEAAESKATSCPTCYRLNGRSLR